MIKTLLLSVIICVASMANPVLHAQPSKTITHLKSGRDQVIVTFGTSLTEKGAWVNLLQEWLDGENFPGKATVLNKGLSGSTTKTHGIPNLARDVLSNQPDTVFIEFGMNDCIQRDDTPVSVPLDRFQANLRQIIQEIRAALPDAEIFLMTMNPARNSPQTPNSGNFRVALPNYYKAVRDIGNEEGISVIDTHRTWLDLWETTPNTVEILIPDGVHPNQEGSRTVTLPSVQKALLGENVPGSWTVTANGLVEFHPAEYQGALQNPLRGITAREYWVINRLEEPGLRTWSSTYRGMTAWDWLENSESDGIDKMLSVTNDMWENFDENNLKVIPFLYLNWPGSTSFDSLPYPFGGTHWPADMTEGDFSSPQFDQRLTRFVERLASLWDEDPRIGFIRTGIYGHWGEQHNPSANEEMIKNTYGRFFKNKKLMVRYPQKWTIPGFEPGGYHDSFASTDETEELAEFLSQTRRWETQPFTGEIAYNYGDLTYVGTTPTRSMLGASPYYIANAARWCHITALNWIGEYGPHTWTRINGKWVQDWPAEFKDDPAAQAEILAGAALIQRHLGYQFILQKVTYPLAVNAAEPFQVEFEVINDGSAPFYYDWKVELSLRDPLTDSIVWKSVFTEADIRQWKPGHGLPEAAFPFPQSWSNQIVPYTTPPQVNKVGGIFALPGSLATGEYVLELAVLDPGWNQPSLRFANWNYRKGRHPLGKIGVGTTPSSPALGAENFASPAYLALKDWQNGLEPTGSIPPPPPAVPGGLSVTPALGNRINLQLTWTDLSDNEFGFLIDRSTDAAFTQNVTRVAFVPANSTAYSDETVLPATTYYYRVRSTDQRRDSAPASASGTTQQTAAIALLNPGFENGNTSGWIRPTGGISVFAPNANQFNDILFPSGKYVLEGTRAAIFNNGPTRLHQISATKLEAGHTYVVQANVGRRKDNYTLAGYRLEMLAADAQNSTENSLVLLAEDNNSQPSPRPGDWITVTTQYAVGPADVGKHLAVRLSTLGASPQQTVFDNVIITRIPTAPAEALTSRGTPVAWLAGLFGPSADYNVLEEIDHDGDGQPTWMEYGAGTDPQDARDSFRITELTVLPGGAIQLKWRASAAHGNDTPFRVLASDTLQAGSWITRADAVPRDPSGTTSWTDQAPPFQNGRIFYRIESTAPSP
jgi:lysophospholipase L1-like esterase